MNKDEALDLALEALEQIASAMPFPVGRKAIKAIKQARALDKKADNARELGLDYEPVLKDNSNYRLDPPVAEPVAWKWHQAPVKTSWGHGMVVADLAIDKDNTVSVYCERDQTAKVVAMFTSQPAQRQWVGLTDEEKWQLFEREDYQGWIDYINAIEAKLKEKNNG